MNEEGKREKGKAGGAEMNLEDKRWDS